METWHAINGVRVVREFADRPLGAAHLKRILNAGRRTGSSKNEQKWVFITVQGRHRLRELAAVGRYGGHLAGAAAAVALVTPDPNGPRGKSIMWDLGRAAQNMVLAAWELGIGSAPATVYYRYAWDRMGRKGQSCVVLVRSRMNSCLVEFEDGYRMVTSRSALRRQA